MSESDLSAELSELAEEFNGPTEEPEPQLDASAPLEDGPITQMPDEAMMAEVEIAGEQTYLDDTGQVPLQNPDPQPPHEPETLEGPIFENYREDPADYQFQAEMDSDRVNIASMPFADYMEWLFPPEGEKGHESGQETLEMVWGNLMAAGYDVDIRKVKIAGALWSRRHYNGEAIKSARYILQRVPASKLIDFIPPSLHRRDWEDLVPESVTLVAENKTMSKSQKEFVIGAGVVSALVIPFLMSRRG
jgi:hypothetical protein